MIILAYIVCGLSTVGIFAIQFVILWFLTNMDALAVIAVSVGISSVLSVGLCTKIFETLEDTKK